MNMVKSTGWGKTLTKVQNLKGIGLFSLFLILIASCAKPIPRSSETYLEPFIQDSIPYVLSSREKPADKLILFLPPALDSDVVFMDSKVAKQLYKRGYDLLRVDKMPPQGKNFYRRKSLDYKGQRAQNVSNLMQQLKRQGKVSPKADISIIGVEEGAYLAAALGGMLGADTVVFINGGPFSVFGAMERIAEHRIPYEPRAEWLKTKLAIDSLAELQNAVERVKTEIPQSYVLGQQTNMYWLSYHDNYFIEDYQNYQGRAIWIFFKDYPLYVESDLSYLKVLNGMRKTPLVNYHLLEGKGNLEDWRALEKEILGYFP